MAKREVKQWITINGIHVPIYEGQSKGQAVKGFLENASKFKDSKKKTLDSDKVRTEKKNDNNKVLGSKEQRLQKDISEYIDNELKGLSNPRRINKIANEWNIPKDEAGSYLMTHLNSKKNNSIKSSQIDKDEKMKQDQIKKNEEQKKQLNGEKSTSEDKYNKMINEQKAKLNEFYEKHPEKYYYDASMNIGDLDNDLEDAEDTDDLEKVRDSIDAMTKDIKSSKFLNDAQRNKLESRLRDLYDQTERREKSFNGDDSNNSADLKQKWLEAKHKFGPYSDEAMVIKNKLDDAIEREAYEANGLKYNKAALNKPEKMPGPDPENFNKMQINKSKETAAKLNELEAIKDRDKTADSLIEKARKEEPQVTKDLQDIVSKGTGKLFGLDFRIKGKGSLSEKLERKAVEKGITVQEYAKKVTDVLRYTEMSNDNDLYKNFSSFVANLKAKGYEMIEVNNTWTEGSVYKGINTLVRNKNGYVFEMQFHTQRSFDVKEVNHKLYEESRKLNTSRERKAELTFQMIKNAESVTFPKDIDKIKNKK